MWPTTRFQLRSLRMRRCAQRRNSCGGCTTRWIHSRSLTISRVAAGRRASRDHRARRLRSVQQRGSRWFGELTIERSQREPARRSPTYRRSRAVAVCLTGWCHHAVRGVRTHVWGPGGIGGHRIVGRPAARVRAREWASPGAFRRLSGRASPRASAGREPRTAGRVAPRPGIRGRSRACGPAQAADGR